MKSPARGGLTSAPQFLMFIDGCVELSWKWGVPKQYLKWEVVPDQPVEAEKPRLINFFYRYLVYVVHGYNTSQHMILLLDLI